MPTSLPPRPSLEWLRKSAKDRLADLRAADPNARLADAQLSISREYGFPSWRALKAHVESVVPPLEADAGERVMRALLEAARTGQIEQVRAMLASQPALINAHGPHPYWGGRPQPLHMAIESGHRDLVERLLDLGADPSGDNGPYDHWSPIMLAIHSQRADLCDLLVARGARVGLVEALMMGDDQRVAQLTDDGRLPSVVPNNGSLLAFARTTFAIDRLLALGASAEVADKWDTTPAAALSRLGERGRELVDHLIARGVEAAPEEFARLGDLDTLKALVRADASLATRDTVMTAAVGARRHAVVEWLLARGGNPNARSTVESRHTALHSASWNGDLRMAQLLVEAGADLTARDAQYDAPPEGWAETSVEVTGNAACREVAEYLRLVKRGER